jgi:hypothetical protein
MLGREKFLKLIESNIDKYGYHITIVSMSELPRFAYSIGLKDVLGFEVILAGSSFYMHKDILIIFDEIVSKIRLKESNIESKIPTENLGSFTLREAKESWCEKMMLGVYDYLNIKEFKGLQIIPDSEHYTSDIPEMDNDYQESEQPIWKWLTKKWTYPVPKKSTATTNLGALKGETITEVMRWEEDSWEMFTMPGSDVPDEDVRIVSLGTILGIDESLLPSVHHKIEEGMWRNDRNSDWNKWK